MDTKHIIEKLAEASQDAGFVAESIADLARSEDALISWMARPYLEEFLRIQKDIEDLISIISGKPEPLNNVTGQMTPASMSMENAEKMRDNLGFFKDDLMELSNSGNHLLNFYAMTVLNNQAVFDRITQLGNAIIKYSQKRDLQK